MRTLRSRRLLLSLSLLLGACGDTGSTGSDAGDAHGPGAEAPDAPTNRIDVPDAVRRNLGITFVPVEARPIERTTRLPGRFELPPQARRAYHAVLVGKVEILVEQYAPVSTGDVLFRLDSPAWREVQRELVETINAVRETKAKLDAIAPRTDAVAAHARSLRAQRSVWEETLRELGSVASAVGGVRSEVAEARAQRAAVETSLAEVLEEEAELASQRSALEAALASLRESTPVLYAEALDQRVAGPVERDVALARAAALIGPSVDELREPVGEDGARVPRWRAIDAIDVRAREDGVVEDIPVSNGAWVEAGVAVLETVDPRRVRFRASGLQADLARLESGLAATVLAPGGRVREGGLRGTVRLGTEADPRTRTVDVLITPEADDLPHWARAGVSTEVEIVLPGASEPQLAVPVASVIQDGLERILFLRDPKDPDRVIRTPADLGASDGRWIVVESGLAEGDEVVHHGVYELMLASGDAKQQGGHFHADGTWHAEDH